MLRAPSIAHKVAAVSDLERKWFRTRPENLPSQGQFSSSTPRAARLPLWKINGMASLTEPRSNLEVGLATSAARRARRAP